MKQGNWVEVTNYLHQGAEVFSEIKDSSERYLCRYLLGEFSRHSRKKIKAPDRCKLATYEEQKYRE